MTIAKSISDHSWPITSIEPRYISDTHSQLKIDKWTSVSVIFMTGPLNTHSCRSYFT